MKLNFTSPRSSQVPIVVQFVNTSHKPKASLIQQPSQYTYNSNMISRIQNGGKCLACNK